MKPKVVLIWVAAVTGILVIALLVTIAILNARRLAHLRKLNATVTATVTEANLEYYSRATEHVRLKYRYLVNGQSFWGEDSKDANARFRQLAAGKTVRICYDPGHPEDSVVAESDCGQ
ncbi:MAG TPA: DUF3592 domain-containing protein [Pyrinomonadaceae bacterium]|nr:DUF3592 domain-containing protein [Pyrinomonadaceae bacterium]